ncbi:MAG: DUF427 domain-containing protein [Gammaproteobacteria bacterium]|nr:DUF427 domain-containing protein [Gammaproteobacteria bacterium]
MTDTQSSEPIQSRSEVSPSYRFIFEPESNRVTAQFQGLKLADSQRAMRLEETRIAPVFYFPREDVRMDLCESSDFATYCPFKGNAAHYSLRIGKINAENLLWSYEDPFSESAQIKDYVAFYPDQVEIDYPEDGSKARSIERNRDSQSYANPLLSWVLQEAPALATASELTAAFARQMRAAGIPLWRMSIIIRILHPQVAAFAHSWHSVTGELVENEFGHEGLQSPEYLNSPLVPIFEGIGGVRRRLDIKDPVLDFGVLHDLHAEGATDYVAMPMLFSDGQINAVCISSNRPGGFTTEDLGYIYEILAVLGRIYEVHALQHKAVSLLDTYLGSHAGERVLNGLIRRGDGQDIRAVIWFCDLRGSTPLALSMSRTEFLAYLNEFFDCVAGAVLDHGGQILRFIGDAALAIFPLEQDDDGADLQQTCEQAIAAARQASSRIRSTNEERKQRSLAPIEYGIALHVGDVTYGNIGTGNRLEFTVIGEAANLAARIESMCKTLGKPVLLSREFAACAPDRVVSVGTHQLKGIDEPQEIYMLSTNG